MITPLDIQSKEFKKRIGGYEKADVDEFFALVCEEYDKLYTENGSLRERVNTLTEAVKQYRTIEDTLQDTLVIAQKTGEEVKKSAYDKGEVIISEATARAGAIIEKAKADSLEIIKKNKELKAEFEACKAKLLSILNSEIAILEQAELKPETEEENKTNGNS